jgi:phosphotransferase system HPr (HPr) family protein
MTINHSSGLHARPASLFAKLAASFPCAITIRNMTSQKAAVNAKSVLSVLTQGINHGDVVEVVAVGERANEALQTLQDIVNSNFGESTH